MSNAAVRTASASCKRSSLLALERLGAARIAESSAMPDPLPVRLGGRQIAASRRPDRCGGSRSRRRCRVRQQAIVAGPSSLRARPRSRSARRPTAPSRTEPGRGCIAPAPAGSTSRPGRRVAAPAPPWPAPRRSGRGCSSVIALLTCSSSPRSYSAGSVSVDGQGAVVERQRVDQVTPDGGHAGQHVECPAGRPGDRPPPWPRRAPRSASRVGRFHVAEEQVSARGEHEQPGPVLGVIPGAASACSSAAMDSAPEPDSMRHWASVQCRSTSRSGSVA